MRKIVSTALAVLVAAAFVSGAGAQTDAATLDSGEQALLAEVNAFRAARGLATLTVSDTLTASAKWMSTDMATVNYFSHTSSDGRSPFQRMTDAGYPVSRTYTGENIAAGYTEAAKVLQGWINSPAHFAVLTNPNYRAIGIGRAYSAGSTYRWYWTANFGGLVDTAAAAPVAAPAPVAPVAHAVPNFPPASAFSATWAGQSAWPVLAPGATTTVVLALLNTGSTYWVPGQLGSQVNLGTADPQDAARPEIAQGWLALNRPATTTTPVAPGQVGWFAFQVKAPAAPGHYKLAVRGVADGVTWLADEGIHWVITVR